ALALPQAAQAHGCPQLERLCPLPAGHRDRLLKVCFGFHLRLGIGGEGLGNGRVARGTCHGPLSECEDAFETIELGGAYTLSGFVHYSERLRQHAQPFLCLSHFPPIRLGEHGKEPRPCQRCPCGLPGRETLAYLRNPCLALSLCRQCPASV